MHSITSAPFHSHFSPHATHSHTKCTIPHCHTYHTIQKVPLHQLLAHAPPHNLLLLQRLLLSLLCEATFQVAPCLLNPPTPPATSRRRTQIFWTATHGWLMTLIITLLLLKVLTLLKCLLPPTHTPKPWPPWRCINGNLPWKKSLTL